ncbi:MAG: tripartite tricarboxylate transporter substrate binding protein [Methylobacteriaceae bacterium]|nr:tripartite tricarboxylate transporter substrate binding protein [Methylobacteriaceae bacterium]
MSRLRLTRRRFAALGLAASFATPARAAFPDKPIRLLVPFAPGGGTDIVARFIGEKLGAALGQPVIVDNRPGGNGVIAGEALTRSAPDGHTLLVATAAGFASAPALGAKLPYDTVKDFAPVGMLGLFPLVLVGAPNLPANTLAEFIALAKAKPGELNYASAGVGGTNHLVFEMFAQRAGVKLAHVPYKGAALATTDLRSGAVHVMVDSLAASLGNIQAKAVKCLAVTMATRQPQIPETPTLKESGVDLVYPGWAALAAPAATPAAVIAQLSRALADLMAQEETKARYRQLVIEPAAMTPQETAAFIAQDRAQLTELVKKLDIKLEQ